MRRLSHAAVILVGFVIASLAAMPIVIAASGDEGSFASKTNGERSSRGISTLGWSDDLARVARNHSQEMANQNDLHHNRNLGSEVSGWEVIGENVGYGPSVNDLHQAFMNSTAHRDNILDRDYTEIGVGTVWKDGTLWVTEVFMRPARSSSSSSNSARSYRPAAPSRRRSVHAASVPSAVAPAPHPAPRSLPTIPTVPALPPVSQESTPATDLTRQMVNALRADDPAVGTIAGSMTRILSGRSDEGDVLSLTFRPFAALVARVNRTLLGR